jgi:quinol monooxygenase YgiN
VNQTIRHQLPSGSPLERTGCGEISPQLVEKLKAQPGFLVHVAFVDNGRFTVSEIWESQEQQDRWFDENVKPNVPDVEQEAIELHSVQTP